MIRLAYNGTSLFVQTIVFDDKVVTGRILDKLYVQDGIEMCLNSFTTGFKYNVGLCEQGPVVHRNRFHGSNTDRLYTPEQVPRSIKVLENAKDVPERSLIE